MRFISLLLILMGGFTTPARAADGFSPPTLPSLDPNKRIPPVEIVRVDIGFTPESFARGRYSPVRVWLTSRERAFTGTLAIRFPQDSTQHAAYLIPATTTPGRVTPHEIAAYLPAEVPWVDVSMSDGNRGASVRLSQYSSDDSTSLPADTQGQLTVLVIGDLEFAHSALKTPVVAAASLAKAGGDAALSLWDNTDAVMLSPDEMFLCWPSYDGADLVIASADALDAADPRARSALRTWVQSGGRLLVVADGAGPVWRELWAEQMQLPLQLSDIERVTAGQALERVLDPATPAEDSPSASNALTVSARVASLTAWGASNGWKLDLMMTRTGGDSAGGLLATGPFGGGIAGLLTIEPQRLSKTLSASAAENIYRHITQGLAPQGRIKEVTELSNRWMRRYYLERDSRRSLERLAEDANDFPEIGPMVFILITVAMSGMGLLIGPVDALLTRRRARRGITTWWTAMGWILLASTVAILAPALARSGKTHFNHASARDVLISSDTSALEWSTDLFATFAGKPIRYQIPSLPDGTWCRGVSLNGSNGGSGTAFTPLTLPVSATAEGLWQSRPAPLVQSQWTLRTLLNTSSPRPSSVRASLEQRGEGFAFSLSGLDPRAIVAGVHIEAMGHRFVVTPGTGAKTDSLPDQQLKIDLSPRPSSAPMLDEDAWNEPSYSAAGSAIGIDRLSGFDGRTDALRHLRDAGTHATANVFFRLPPSGVPDGLNPQSTQQASTLRLRVTFPIDEQTAQALQAFAKREANQP